MTNVAWFHVGELDILQQAPSTVRTAVVLAHGPSNNAETRASLERMLRERGQWEGTVFVTTRDLCGLETNENGPSVYVVNCDVNEEVDRPVNETAKVQSVFLFHEIGMKRAARLKGWKRFACVPPTHTYYTGISALMWLMCNFDVNQVYTLGVDFDEKYLEASTKSARSIGIFATQNANVRRRSMMICIKSILICLRETEMMLSTPSAELYRWMMQANADGLSVEKIANETKLLNDALIREREEYMTQIEKGELVLDTMSCALCGRSVDNTEKRHKGLCTLCDACILEVDKRKVITVYFCDECRTRS